MATKDLIKCTLDVRSKILRSPMYNENTGLIIYSRISIKNKNLSFSMQFKYSLWLMCCSDSGWGILEIRREHFRVIHQQKCRDQIITEPWSCVCYRQAQCLICRTVPWWWAVQRNVLNWEENKIWLHTKGALVFTVLHCPAWCRWFPALTCLV